MNLSVGQGDLGATPLQLAVAYAALGNGGDVVRPHLADRIENALGEVTSEIDPAPSRELDISPETRTVIMDGLHAAAMEPGGTSYPIFGGFPVDGRRKDRNGRDDGSGGPVLVRGDRSLRQARSSSS